MPVKSGKSTPVDIHPYGYFYHPATKISPINLGKKY
jgi:hypothetical protein